MAEDLKELFNNFDKDDTKEKAKEKVREFIQKWESKYSHIKNHFSEEELAYYFTY